MQEIAQNLPQIGDFDKCSSGSRILRSYFATKKTGNGIAEFVLNVGGKLEVYLTGVYSM